MVFTNGIIDVEVVQPDPLAINGTVQYYVGNHNYPRHWVANPAEIDEIRLSFNGFHEIPDPLTDPAYLDWINNC